VDRATVDTLQRLIEQDTLWDEALIEHQARELAASPDPAARELAGTFRALHLRLGLGPVPDRLRREVEGVFYPRLWKALEAVRLDLPPGEALTRVQVLNRRLARIFAEETS
jgi:hypothetical protein